MANENIQELKFQVGEVWKGVYSSSTPYGLANVVQDPTGLSIYRSLKSGNVGHPLNDRTWWFCIIDMSSIKAESDRITALNQAIAQDEALRVAAEELRQQHETERIAAETQRNEAEQARVNAEQERVGAESARATAEQQRITAEQERVSAESARVQAEQARVLSETLRANAEDQRAANEQNRIAAEQQRIERAESDHQRVESDLADIAVYTDSLGAFDLSKHNAVDGVLATYADLSAALTALNALDSKYKYGGMSFKFVLTSDNKYVQYRLTADEWSVNTEDWAIAEEGVYAESPEFVYVKTDKDGKILWAIKTDGGIYYGAGVPQQVIDYIEEKIADLSLDEYEDIVAFLNGLEKGDKTLQTLLNEKVDKEEGKALIDAEYASTKSTVNNQEFLEVAIDAEDKVLEGIREDGTKVISGNLDVGGSAKVLGEMEVEGSTKIFGEMEVAGVTYKVVESPEYIAAWVDAENKVIFGLKTDGKTYVGDANFLNEIKNNQEAIREINATIASINTTIASISATIELLDIDTLSSIIATESPEYIEATTDSEGKLLAGRTPDGAAFENVGFSTPHINVGGFAAEHTEDPENRIEVKTDAEDKVVSYRDKEGVLHEIIGVETDVLKAGSFSLPEDTKEEVKNIIDTNIPPKKWYLPKFGSVNIKQETFYLDAGNWSSYENDVVLIQMYDDNAANASRRRTLSTYYIKNTLTPLPGGGYDRTSVNNSSIALELHAGKDVTAIGNKFFATAIYTPVMNGEYIVDYTKNKATKVTDPETGDVIGYTYNGQSTEVKQVTDVPPYKAWKVNKKIEHYCIADIDFGTFYTKSDNAVSIKYQGSGSTQQRKRGLRITFYKNNTYAKKDKIKIGEMVRLSGFNMKSYGRSYSMVNDPVVSYVFIDMWNSRGKDAYPWNKDSVPFNGANGMIKSFPIETRLGGDFFGLQFFSLKKDEKNYMLDGDDDSSGIFVSGDVARSGWEDATPRDWADEMGADDRVVAYPDLEDSVSVETAAAMSELFKRTKGLVDESVYVGTDDNIYALSELTDVEGTLYVTDSLDEGAVVADSIAVTLTDFDISMLEEYIDIESWIDYYIGLQVFQLWDSTYHNVILHTRSDKKKFYMYYYDLDVVCEYAYDEDIIDICRTYWHYSMDFWKKFAAAYKDSIINRYAELRKNVLSINNIRTIYESYTDNIPSSVIEADVAKWNSGRPSNFLYTIEMLDKRLAWLDNNYFNL